ncbi:polysaccharide deacetylase family protein [Ferruginibacter lapsinanis]|uniref:polysaccharide deacetylase family protein n=1 Tax=Ferruginibacter lapsinanis TaxID=563172 RepID=UPI001E459B6A|nr:polysaccharide deacetylase family protein [Ferruginibacter lapsinanis]UEG51207.1 polysaccharide deacetylase family protein [Ferruginibacter lapsinanis]
MVYLAKTPRWLKKIYSSCIWDFYSNQDKVIYLTFDDGPHPVATNFVLNELNKYNAKATFFCIGKNVMAHEDIYKKLISDGHSVGNHTQNHLDGWKTDSVKYLQNVDEAKKHIQSTLFRPPYGRIRRTQLRQLTSAPNDFTIIMWSVLSGDFDQSISKETCLANVIDNAKSGSIIVFHDSEKAFGHLQYVLPKVLEYFSKKGYAFKNIAIV